VKPRHVFVCQECGAQSPKWLGRCADCGAWNSLVEERVAEPATAPAGHRYGTLVPGGAGAQLYADVAYDTADRMSTGIGELDRVLGGGVVPGSLVLLGGEPGIGKSTLLPAGGRRTSRDSRGPCSTAPGEESEHQIKSRGGAARRRPRARCICLPRPASSACSRS
jgi:DNA repair protein RadA/Sms